MEDQRHHLSIDAATSSSHSSQFEDEIASDDDYDPTRVLCGEEGGATSDRRRGRATKSTWTSTTSQMQTTNAAGSNGPPIDTNTTEPAHERTNALQTYLHILKGNIGPGCLSLPWAVSVLGVPLALVTLLSLCAITSFNCWAVVRWKRRHMADRRDITYADLGQLAYGARFRNFVLFCVCATQLCVCTVFFSFIGENISAVLRAIAPGTPLDNSRVVMSLVLPMAMFLSCAPNLKVLSPLSAIGMILLLLAFGCISLIMASNWSDRPTDLPTVDVARIPLAFCAIIYSFEGINLVIPIEAAMADPSQFDKCFALAMMSVTSIYSVFACLCVAAFGPIDNGSVTAFLMDNAEKYSATSLVLASNFIVSISVLLTFPLQLFPAINLISQSRERKASSQRSSSRQCTPLATEEELVSDDAASDNNAVLEGNASGNGSTANFMPLEGEETTLQEDLGTESSHFRHQNGVFGRRETFQGDSPILRACLVFSTFAIAISIPNVQELISLSGAFAGSSCALIVPPLLELRSIVEGHHRFSLVAISRYVLLAIGVVFLVIGTVASIIDIVEAFGG
mmetsp:Transcript_32064/g.94359  ORF Transcript_32064/g.94359 Transcript_32064/m.94359 type:complete len:567 (+) Transcript_32064:114-1814(+)